MKNGQTDRKTDRHNGRQNNRLTEGKKLTNYQK